MIEPNLPGVDVGDKILKCKGGHEFIFTVKEQEFFAEHQWADPIRCIPCRKENKLRHNRQPRAELNYDNK